MRTRGIRPNFVEVAGEAVEGLYYDRSLNVYYYYTIDPITKKRKKVTRRNKAKAALELYNYKLETAEQDFTKVFFDSEDDRDGGALLKSSDDKSYILAASMPDKQQVEYIDADGCKCLLTTDEVFNVPNDFIIERFVELLDASPREIAEIFIKMGREDLAGIINLPKNYKRSKTKLSDVLEWYLTEEERSRDTIRYSRLFWKQFCDIVNVPYLEQITLSHIKAYKQQLKAIRTRRKLSAKWLSLRYESVRRVVRHAKLHTENKRFINDILDDMEILKAPGGKANSRTNPRPISKNEFQLMLNYFRAELAKANTPTRKIRYSKWIAIFMTAANTCSYFQDLCDMTLVKKAGHLGLDLDNNTLSMYREKKSTVKVAVLWKETVEAIVLFRKHQGCQTEYVFETKSGKKNTASRLRDEFWRYIRPKIAAHYDNEELLRIEFNQIRDAGFTACAVAELHIEQRNYVSGHKNTGDDDAYLLRQPRLAKPACEAIYSYFFGEGQKVG